VSAHWPGREADKSTVQLSLPFKFHFICPLRSAVDFDGNRFIEMERSQKGENCKQSGRILLVSH
jgi:hypothetical protein